jgi:hypothetical protein
VRKLLSVDPASATLADERGRTPLSLLFDDYAEEVMEALEEDVTREMARRRIEKGGELSSRGSVTLEVGKGSATVRCHCGLKLPKGAPPRRMAPARY